MDIWNYNNLRGNKKRNEGMQLKFLKQNILTLIVLILLLISVNKMNSLQVVYNELNSQMLMLQSTIQNIHRDSGFIPPQNPPKAAKEVMSPLELAEYLNIDMMLVYDMTEKDLTMPYIEIDGEYRFNKAAIDKWMETRRTIEIE